jgi:hypothetical protein
MILVHYKDGIFKSQMNEMCDIFIMCFVLFLFVTCFGWNFNAIVVVVVVEGEEDEEEGGREGGGGTELELKVNNKI